MGATLAEKFCAHHRLEPERFVDSMFWRCLHRRAWLLVPLLRAFDPEYFQADYDLLHSVGKLTSAEQLEEELQDYYSHSGNYGYLRRGLRLRVSVRRLAKIVHQFLPGRTSADSRAPH
jgi:hypothetical protein